MLKIEEVRKLRDLRLFCGVCIAVCFASLCISWRLPADILLTIATLAFIVKFLAISTQLEEHRLTLHDRLRNQPKEDAMKKG
jgi:hypothetical protein